MFDFLDVADLLKTVDGKMYDKNQVVQFTIKEVKTNKDYKTINVKCEDHEGDTYNFKLGGENPSPTKKRTMISFLTAFYSREELIAKSANPVELVGQRFEVKSDGQLDYEGKKYQRWSPTFRKLEAIASAEEFVG
jgi:hypothetical protein